MPIFNSQIIVGRKRPSTSITNKDKKKKKKEEEEQQTPGSNTQSSKAPIIGEFVALRLKKYEDEIPQVGKVVGMNDLELDIEWWIGGWGINWTQWKTRGQPNIETVHKNAIIMAPIVLTKSYRLSKATQKQLKELYEVVELM